MSEIRWCGREDSHMYLQALEMLGLCVPRQLAYGRYETTGYRVGVPRRRMNFSTEIDPCG